MNVILIFFSLLSWIVSSSRDLVSHKQLLARRLQRCVYSWASGLLALESVRGKASAATDENRLVTESRKLQVSSAKEVSDHNSSNVILFSFGNIEETADFIKEHCSVILSAAQSTGRLLYRGESVFENALPNNQIGDIPVALAAAKASQQKSPLLMFPKPDLLLPETYDSPTAADFFTSVSEYIDKDSSLSVSSASVSTAATAISSMSGSRSVTVTPRNGHLATPNVMDASRWGPVCTVWPLDGLSYAWLAKDNSWWNNDFASPQGKRGPVFWRNPAAMQRFMKEEVRINRGLEGALARGAEVLFTSTVSASYLNDLKKRSKKGSNTFDISDSDGSSSTAVPLFVAVPTSLEGRLLKLLDITPFSTSVKTTVTEGMDVSGTVKRSRVMRLISLQMGVPTDS